MKTCKVCGDPLSKHDYVSIVNVWIEKRTPGCWAGNEEHKFTVENVHSMCADAIVSKLRGLLARTMEGKLVEEERGGRASCKFDHKKDPFLDTDVFEYEKPEYHVTPKNIINGDPITNLQPDEHPSPYPDKEADMDSYPLGEDV